MKICRICKLEKDDACFRVDRGYVRGECKMCAAKQRQEHYAADPAKYSKIARDWSKANPEKRNATKRAWTAKNRGRVAVHVRKVNYGMPEWDFKLLLDAQSHRCAICESVLSATPRAVHVDHCHASGKVRGILCSHCNNILGRAQDSVSVLEKAIIYLQKSR